MFNKKGNKNSLKKVLLFDIDRISLLNHQNSLILEKLPGDFNAYWSLYLYFIWVE
jgi:hypothetical protein